MSALGLGHTRGNGAYADFRDQFDRNPGFWMTVSDHKSTAPDPQWNKYHDEAAAISG